MVMNASALIVVVIGLLRWLERFVGTF